MGLQDALRKAASLLVEMPDKPEAEDLAPATTPEAPVEDAFANAPREPLDVDALLAEQGIGRGARNAAVRPVPVPGPVPAKPVATKTVEEIVAAADGPSLADIKATVAEATPASKDNAGAPDCAAIYAAAKLPVSDFGAEQMLEMLATLPADLSLETRRTTVRVMLQALGQRAGTTPQSIVTDASRKMAALAAYSEFAQQRAGEIAAQTETEIASMEQQIADKRKSIEAIKQQAINTMAKCTAESGRLDDVLEFFSLDVPPSKYADSTPPTSPKK